MAEGIRFVMGKPIFNKTNPHALYSILSDGCLLEEKRLKEGDFYRYDGVSVDGYLGCPAHKITESMDSLFRFVEDNLQNPKTKHILPHIVHYYLLYVHPYFDYNGRTARMSSFGIRQLLGEDDSPTVLSEAINRKKKRILSCFREYPRCEKQSYLFFEIRLSHDGGFSSLLWERRTYFSKLARQRGTSNGNRKNYFRKILLSYKGKFTYNDFEVMAKIDVIKQGALKILNRFAAYGLLVSSESNSRNKLFALNADALLFLSPELQKTILK